jgi:[calcium/calmodulin-dependent protein kinase] kinase
LGSAPLAGAAAAAGDVWLDTATGTPAFYAPEMCQKGSYLGMPADIWAAGVTLCMMTGASPFAAPHAPAMFARIRSSDPDLPPDASPGLRRMLSRMLEKDPRKRATMAELLTDPWVTDGGRFPMPTNFALVTVDEADIAEAVGTRFGSAVAVLKASSARCAS